MSDAFDKVEVCSEGGTKEIPVSDIEKNMQAALVDEKNATTEDQKELTALKKQLGNKVFVFMTQFACFVGVVIVAYMTGNAFGVVLLPENVILALITTTLATVIGLVSFILKGLFPNK